MTNSDKNILSKLGGQTNFSALMPSLSFVSFSFCLQWIWYIQKSVTVTQVQSVHQAARRVQSSTWETVVLGSLVWYVMGTMENNPDRWCFKVLLHSQNSIISGSWWMRTIC